MLTALPTIAVLAALGVLLAVSHHGSVLRDRHAEMRNLAAAAATNARRFIDDQFATLSAVAAAPAVREGRRAQVGPYLRMVARSARYTAGMGLVGSDGRLRASSMPIPRGGVTLGDRPYVRMAFRRGRPSVSDALIGRARRTPVIAFAYPVASLAGPRNGVVVGSVRLDRRVGAGRRLL
jgi:hypothetical protein